MVARVAINGFGRIGRAIARILATRGEELELVAVNDLTDAHSLAHLLAFDSIHGRFDARAQADGRAIEVGGRSIAVLSERDPAKLPWKALGVDVVLECTGRFVRRADMSQHLEAGAGRVILSAPAKDPIDATICIGINDDTFDRAAHRLISSASCTTNCLAPMVAVLDEAVGIRKAHMLTVHSYTNDQSILDQPHRDPRRARAAAMSMIPTSTGAAKAISAVLPSMEGRLTGAAIRVPTPNVSITCLTAHVERGTTAEAVNEAFRHAAASPKLRGVLAVEDRPLVSIDYVGTTPSCTVDSGLTAVTGEDLVHIEAWYDNEWGFSSRMVDLAALVTGTKD